MPFKRDIYFHVLDRELQQTLATPLSENMILRLLRVGLLATQNLYISFSHLCESSQLYPNVTKYLLFLQERSAVAFLLADRELGAFYEKRQELYFFDKDRYPFYFQQNKIIRPVSPCLPRETSSTEFIRNSLIAIKHEDLRVRKLHAAKNPYVLELLEKHMPENPLQALTIHAFEPAFEDTRIFSYDKQHETKARARQELTEALSYFHSEAILNETGTTIFTDIPSCEKYDILAYHPYYSFQIYELILSPLIDFVEVTDPVSYQKQLEDIIDFRNSDYFQFFCTTIYNIVCEIYQLQAANKSLNYNIWYWTLCQKIKKVVYNVRKESSFQPFCIDNAILYIERLESALQSHFFIERTSTSMLIKEKKKVLILTANDIEHHTALEALDQQSIAYNPVSVGSNVYYQASLDNNNIYILKCMPGSVGSASSTLAVYDAINQLKPVAIIAGGVAFGCKKDKQKMGDILLSKQIWQYDPQKQTETQIIRRGDKATSSAALLNRFSSAIAKWERDYPNISIHTGLIASGEVLVNNPTFVEQLKQSEPEIIGGEMEGAGILSAAERKACDWILVKAICDWGAKKTDEYQPQAAKNAFQFIFYVLKEFPL